MVLAGTLAATAVTAGAQSSGGGAPKATDVGITATEIHVAIIADVDNPILPNLFKGSKDAVEGFGQVSISKAGGGGLAGRKVVVDFYDSKINPNETRNAKIQACQNDFADGRHLGGVPDDGRRHAQLQGQDRRGDGPAGHPVRHDRARAAVLGPVVPDGAAAGDLRHRQRSTRRPSRRASAAAYYYQKKYGKDLHGFYVFGNDSKSARDSSFSSGLGQMRVVGFKSDEDFDRSSSRRRATSRRSSSRSRATTRTTPRQLGLADHPPQGGDAPGHHRGQGVGLRRAVLRQDVPHRRRH